MTRQAYYQHYWQLEDISYEQELILNEVRSIRKNHSRMGTRKLYGLLEPMMLEHQIKLGRDALFDLLANHNLLVRKRRKSVKTTNSFHWLRKYPNLIKDYLPNNSNELWVSDITYWKTEGQVYYISFITDVYSHKIVGYNVAETLEAFESIQALQMALKSRGSNIKQLIHHSDRGIQYCSHEYVKLLKSCNILISMTENGDPRENAVAERVNGIIKGEYLQDNDVGSISEAKELLEAVVHLYNEERPHMSIQNLTPSDIHQNNRTTSKLWKSRYIKSAILVKD
jgi:putative transposase